MPTILIINSNQNISSINKQLENLFADEFSDIIQIERLQSANDLLASINIDLVAVVCDLCNTQYVRNVRQVTGALPVLVLCPETPFTVTSALLNSGADEVLSLNCPKQEILAKLRALLRRPLRYCVDSSAIKQLPN
jgi:DNA-binding response OmpR family regulator